MINEQENETLGPLISARERIDAAIQAYLDKVAALRKRREVITAAMDLVRSGDDEILNLPVVIKNGNDPHKPKRILAFDEVQVEQAVLDILRSGEATYSRIASRLRTQSLEFSDAGLRRILKTCPHITQLGERGRTRFAVSNSAKSGESK